MTAIRGLRQAPWAKYVLPGVVIVAVALLPFFRPPLDGFMDDCILALIFVTMALGLNLIVGFAGLLDLGYVAFYAFGALVGGWWASDHFTGVNGEKGIHLGVGDFTSNLPGIHINFLLLIVGAIVVCAIAGAVIGLPTLRLRGDYIAIVTLAFGEIIGRFAANGDGVKLFGGYAITNGRESISPLDPIDLLVLDQFDGALDLRPFYWTMLAIVLVALIVNIRLRDSRLGRAWVALREDEVAAASMGVPLVKTKLTAYATGGALGGIAGVFYGLYLNSINANQFQFGFSIFILAMVIIGGLGSIWGAVVGGLLLGYINNYLIPNVLNDLPQKLGLNFSLTTIEFGIFGFLLVLVMILRPQGLIPERRRRMEMTAEIAAEDAQLVETTAQ